MAGPESPPRVRGDDASPGPRKAVPVEHGGARATRTHRGAADPPDPRRRLGPQRMGPVAEVLAGVPEEPPGDARAHPPPHLRLHGRQRAPPHGPRPPPESGRPSVRGRPPPLRPHGGEPFKGPSPERARWAGDGPPGAGHLRASLV